MSNISEIIIKLGFDQVLSKLVGHCRTEFGRNLASKITFQKEFFRIKKLLDQQLEFQKFKEEGHPPILHLEDISSIMNYLSKSGAQLEGSDLILLAR